MKIQTIVGGLVLFAVSNFGADVDGKWTGTVSTPNGDAPVAYTFKADGARLTGSTIGPDGSEVKIADGKVDGNNVSFSVTLDFGGMPITMNYKGVLSGNQIKFTLDMFGMPLEIIVRKTT
jgi:hypothetical protein